MWWTKKKQAQGPMVWMIQKRGTKPAQFLGVCKDQLVTLSNWKACFRFSDMDSAGLMIYWMIQAGKVKPNEFEAVPVQLQAEEKRS
jgi:hypothetical protein